MIVLGFRPLFFFIFLCFSAFSLGYYFGFDKNWPFSFLGRLTAKLCLDSYL